MNSDLQEELAFAQYFVASLLNRGVDLVGKRVLDVGCQNGIFMSLMNKYGVNCWGVEHNREFIDAGIKGRIYTNADKPRLLVMSFSEVCEKRPELAGTFDVIKITGVIPYMTPEELSKMCKTAHMLLKPEGSLCIELPASKPLATAYQKEQSSKESVKHIRQARHEREQARQRPDTNTAYSQAVYRFTETCRKLLRLYFTDVREWQKAGDNPPILQSKGLKLEIPAAEDLQINPITYELNVAAASGFAAKLPESHKS